MGTTLGSTLTEKHKQLLRDLVRLCEVSQHRSFRYTPAFNNHDTIEAKGTSKKASGSERDLRTLEAEGFISLRWVRHGAAEGTVCQGAFDAVRDNFGQPPEATAPAGFAPMPVYEPDAAGTPRLTPSANPVAVRATAIAARSGHDVPSLLAGLLSDVVAVLKQVVPPDEAEAAEADAAAVARQLRAARPDVEVVARRTRSMLWRVAAASGVGTDLAAKGGKLGEALQKLAQLLPVISHWAAAHRADG